ncbi:Cytochrome-c3 hydrogenase, gamma subunit [Candidatus Magnetobacterium bavaricum]|uniref:Cytochrome-c3 hydrogenase, gamma subunit n=1 Tax=Candidatus Magnetobacterium bavaricum TaxID=29290 RepID=A0A0F3GPM6_9BACT|nr:Cytochrome-c3 hydrogenase, gamma subunit [Candidatus Magnetobacterium bavaricum]
MPGSFTWLLKGGGVPGKPLPFDPLLKRPFSCMDYSDGLLHFMIKLRGKFTAILGNCTPGSVLELIGPLGNGFPAVGTGERLIVVAGGIGIASVAMLLRDYPEATLFYGVRSANDLFIDRLPPVARLHVTSDNGSVGDKGNVLEQLRQYIVSTVQNTKAAGVIKVYACGPHAMTQQLCRMFAYSDGALPKINGWPVEAFVSVEERMACGVAACLGCAVGTVNGYRLVCKDGPVFNVNELIAVAT